MANKNTDFKEDLSLNIISLSQDSIETGEDSRVWVTVNQSTKIPEYTFWITIDRKIGRRDTNGDISYSDSIVPAWLTIEKITLCINKEQDKIYILLGNPANNVETRIHELTISDMSLLLIDDNIQDTVPFKVILDKINKLWYCASSNLSSRTLAIIDTDGTNISTVNIKSRKSNGTFCLTTDREAFIFSSYTDDNTTSGVSIISKTVANSSGNLEYTEYEGNISSLEYYSAVDSFTIDSYLYFLCKKQLYGSGNKIVKIPVATWNNSNTWEQLDLSTIYSIENEVFQFFTDGFNGYFYENNLSTRQFFWKLNLSNLSCTRLAVYSPQNSIFKWATSGDLIQKVICSQNSNNCDPSGFLTSGKGITGN